MQHFFSGLWTQRSPFNGPDNRYNTRFLGGRPEILTDGLNVELSNYGTIIRRPGFVQFSTALLNGPADTFYSFHLLTGAIDVIADTATQISVLTPTTNTVIFTKSAGASQAYFQGVGNTLYFGDGVDLEAWNPTLSPTVRNWGIAIGSINSAVGPNLPASGTDVPIAGSTVAWMNPGNITATDGVFATITLAPPGSGGNVTESAGTGVDSATGGTVAWSNPGNVASAGQTATVTLAGSATQSHYLKVTNFSFNIPANAIILGITVTDSRSCSPAGEIFTSSIFLVKGGSAVGTDHAIGTALWGGPSPQSETFGSSTDLWGATWLPSDINASNFGFAIQAEQDFAATSTGSIYAFPTITVYYSVPTSGTVLSDYLEGTNFGFSLPSSNTISGIQVTVKGFQSQISGTTLSAIMLKSGNGTGTGKSTVLPATNSAVVLGGASDLWGASWVPNDINQTTFGVALQAVNSSATTGSWSVDSVTITVYGTGGPAIALQTGNGPLYTVNGGWEYVIAYGNSNSGHVSSPSPPSLSTGNFGGFGTDVNTSGTAVTLILGSPFITNGTWNGRTITINGVNYVISSVASTTTLTLTTSAGTQTGVTYLVGYASVQVGLTMSNDPQVNQIHVYRTKDGGSVYYELPNSPFPNTTANILDTSTDAGLQQLIFFPTIPPAIPNTPPPAGLIHLTYHLGRIWGTVGNYVYYSAGPDVLIGNGNESFPPANFFLYPSNVNRLVPISSGLLVFTTDDVYIILGTSLSTFYTMPFQPDAGLLSWNALDVQGSNIFWYTSDRQFVQMSSAGLNQIGYAIGDLIQANINPAQAYVASLISGTSDQAVFLADGSANWYRCNWNQPPEGGPAWSPKATITGSAGAVVSVETSPGIHQLLVSQSNGTVLARSYSVFSDNGAAYGAFMTVGSLVLAQPGQLANVQSITTELQAVGTLPDVAVMMEEISGAFEPLPVYVPDPPGLVPSNSVYSNRYYLTQSQECVMCRHMQIRLTWAPEIAKNELLTLAVFGALRYQD
jgi:hypothetical protein